MVNCPHAASGCGYPEGECSGACMTSGTQRQPAAPHYLTIVYSVHSPGQRQALLHATDWTASSHSHAIHDRNAAIKQRDELLQVLRLARTQLASNLQELISGHTSPQTGLVDEAEVLLVIESEQDLINQIDAAIANAGGAV